MLRFKLTLQSKIILPFFVMLAFVGMIGTALVTARVTSSTVTTFEGSLLRASLLSNDHLAVLEADRLAQLRAAIDTQGVPEAVLNGNTATLTKLLTPIQANAPSAHLSIHVLSGRGDEIVTLAASATGTSPGTQDTALASIPVVQAALVGRSDAIGDKYVFLRPEPAGLMVYWVAPIRTDTSAVVGALLMGQPLTEIADSIRDSRSSELAFYDPAGQVVLSSLKDTPPLTAATLAGVPAGPVRVDQAVNGHPYAFLVGGWRLRQTNLGYLAIALRADGVEAAIAQIRTILMMIFALAGVVTLLLGALLAGRITRPLHQLVASTRVVSAGDLSHRAVIRSGDEIGYLAQSFNEMTTNLQEKTRALEENYFASIEALARAIDARDPYTFGHSTRVAAISLEVADAIKLSKEDQATLRRAALLHDIGKIGVEDRILRKASPLTDEEWEAMRQHPVIGYKMLTGLHFLEHSLPGVLHHHERWDGQGYPLRLKGEGIPPYVRVLSLADALDAMTSDRPYRKGLSLELATDEIVRLAGVQFDPNVVEAFTNRTSRIALLLMDKPRASDPREALLSLRGAA